MGFDELVLQTNPEDIPLAKEEVGMIMRVARKIPPGDDDNFAVNSADAYMEQFNTMKSNSWNGIFSYRNFFGSLCNWYYERNVCFS